jgi:choline kinase
MRLIILAAGQGFKLDGFNTLLIKHPKTKETIIEKYMRLFNTHDVTIVTGHRGVELMSHYPDLNYIHNDQWRISGNSYTLSLALDEQPTIVISSDLVFDERMVKLIEEAPDNAVFTLQSENKGVNTVRCKIKEGIIESIYHGEQQNEDPETIGIYKITSPQILREWKKNCTLNKNVFAGLNLPLNISQIAHVAKGDIPLHEINTPLDYLNLIKHAREE